MPDPVSFPGLKIIRFQFQLEPGGQPSYGTIRTTTDVQFSNLGTLAFFDPVTGDTWTFSNCRIWKTHRDDLSSGEGELWVHYIEDRRWVWGQKFVRADYNLPQGSGYLRERSPQQIATELFQAAGETLFDVTQMPNTARPRIVWDDMPVSLAFGDLTKRTFSRVVLDSTDTFRVLPLIAPPAPDPIRSVNVINPIPRLSPSKITLLLQPTIFELDMLLEPVVYDADSFAAPFPSPNRLAKPLRDVFAVLLAGNPNGYKRLDPYSGRFAQTTTTTTVYFNDDLFRLWRPAKQNPAARIPEWLPDPSKAGVFFLPSNVQSGAVQPVASTDNVFLLPSLSGGEKPFVWGPVNYDAYNQHYRNLVTTSTSTMSANLSPRLYDIQVLENGFVRTSTPLFDLTPSGLAIDPLLALVTGYQVTDANGKWERKEYSRTLSGTGGEIVFFSDLRRVVRNAALLEPRPFTGSGSSNDSELGARANAELNQIAAGHGAFSAYEVKYAGLRPYLASGFTDYVRWEGGATLPPLTFTGFRSR